jgi:hypothetical protein
MLRASSVARSRGRRRRPHRRSPRRLGPRRPTPGSPSWWPGPAWSQIRPGRDARGPHALGSRVQSLAGTAPGRPPRAQPGWCTQQDHDLGMLDPARSAGVLALDPDGLGALLQIAGLVHHQHRWESPSCSATEARTSSRTRRGPTPPGPAGAASHRGWHARRARPASSSACAAGPKAAPARTPGPADVAPPAETGPRPGPATPPALPANGRRLRLRCGLRPPSDLRLSTQRRIINGGRPALLTGPAPEQPGNDLRLEY